MYHIGLVQELVSPGAKGMVSADTSVQAVVRMWDENLLILGVDRRIARKVKKGDYVLADYTPLSPDSNHRKLVIIKALPSEEGGRVWTEFREEFEKRRNRAQQQQQQNYQYIR